MLRQHAWGMNALGLLPLQLETRIPKVEYVSPRGGGILSREKEGRDPYTHFCLYYKKSKLGPDPRKMKMGPVMSKKNNFAST